MTAKSKKFDIGRRFAAARRERGLSQTIVARRAGMAPSYLSRIENGKVHPTLRTSAAIASVLHVSLDDLLGVLRDAHRRGACPVSRNGACLMDITRAETAAAGPPGEESYSPRQVRLLRRFNELLALGSPEVTRALEVLLGEFLHGRVGRPAGS